MTEKIKINVNEKEYELMIEPSETLIDVLRNRLGLTGTKEGCGVGDCGACTVLVDGKAVNSCLMLCVAAEGREIVTIEGIAQNGELHAIQQAFVDEGAIQCGYCTPGMVLSSVALLEEIPRPTKEEIKFGIAGNLCRCTGYTKIINAIETATEDRD
jgi:carbon-monoxide dehydrogenase small subunit